MKTIKQLKDTDLQEIAGGYFIFPSPIPPNSAKLTFLVSGSSISNVFLINGIPNFFDITTNIKKVKLTVTTPGSTVDVYAPTGSTVNIHYV